MRCLVTGGGGFLGRHVVRQLRARGDEVTVLARGDYPDLAAEGVHMVRCDLQDRDGVRQACAGIHTVFHVAALAGLSGPYSAYHRANVLGTRNVLAACKSQSVSRLVYTSTPSVVFSSGDIRAGDEALAYAGRPMSFYQRSKIEAEKMVLAANGDSGLQTTALRPHAIWGPGDVHLMPRFIALARSGKLRRIGAGDNLISVSYVENAAAAHLQAAASRQAAGRTYFVNETEPVNLWQWLDAWFRRLGAPTVQGSMPFALAYAAGAAAEWTHRAWPARGEPRVTRYLAALLAKHHYFRVDRAVRDFGFHCPVPLHSAMERADNYYRQGAFA